jgi:CDP-glycerol glycerophosphotransferase (TagB/SpsB family)
MIDAEKYAIENIGLKITINLKEFKKIKILCNIDNKNEKIDIGLGKNSYFDKSFGSMYRSSNNYYIKYNKTNNCFNVFQKNIKNKILLSSKLYLNLIKKKKFKNILYRIVANIYSIFCHKKIWLISDRIQYANDNGEAFFEYVMNNKKDNKHKYYFIIKKGCKDYKRLKENYPKNVIAYNSFKYKILFLKASKIVSAHADDYITNAFGKSKKYMTDMYNFKYVFLQHGITKDDLSPWLNINSKQIDLFICSSEEEYKSLTNNNYRYNFPKKNIALTGLARFDKLLKKDIEQANIIMLAPTWRAYIAGDIDPKTGKRAIDNNFIKTEYYNFYNELINNKKLIKYLNENNYKIRFIPHQNMHQYINFFDKNDTVEIVTKSITYSKEFKQSKLLITDFSSTFFDFGYLHKPVIYSQFDTEKFFEGQIYDKGYFDYEKDGFGPITKTIEETVDAIIKVIDNNCVIEKKYEQRINKFYKYTDNKNSERTYNKIIELDEKK